MVRIIILGESGIFTVHGTQFNFNTSDEQGAYLDANERPTGVSDCLVLHFKSNMTNSYHRAVILFDTSSATAFNVYVRKFRSSWGDWKKLKFE